MTEQEFFKEIVVAIDSPLYVTDTKGIIIYANPAFEEVTGYQYDELVGQKTSILKSGIMPNSYYENLWKTILSGNTWKEEIVNRRKDGTEYMVLQYVSPVFDNSGAISFFTAVQHDITREKELQNEREIFFDVSVDLFCITDREGILQQSNSAWYSILGWDREALDQRPILDFIHPEDKSKFLKTREQLFDREERISRDMRFRTAEETFKWISWNVYFSKERQLIYASGRDIQERVEKEEEIRRISITDALTGIYNRMKFDQELKQEIARTVRYHSPLSLIMFDIDHFKQVNDTYGHHRGDEVLKEVVLLVQKEIRKTDIFARWGGEEFVLLCPHTEKSDAVALSERIRGRAESHVFHEAGRITLSFGVGSFIEGQDDSMTFLPRIDAALYKAKRRGRNRVETAYIEDKAGKRTKTD